MSDYEVNSKRLEQFERVAEFLSKWEGTEYADWFNSLVDATRMSNASYGAFDEDFDILAGIVDRHITMLRDLDGEGDWVKEYVLNDPFAEEDWYKLWDEAPPADLKDRKVVHGYYSARRYPHEGTVDEAIRLHQDALVKTAVALDMPVTEVGLLVAKDHREHAELQNVPENPEGAPEANWFPRWKEENAAA
jgi:hypothetical protein